MDEDWDSDIGPWYSAGLATIGTWVRIPVTAGFRC